MKTVYFIRHGETIGNARNFYQFPDTPLSEKGMVQAQKVAERCLRVPHEVILHSPYRRAEQTAQAIADKTAKPLVVVHEMHEKRSPSIVWGKPHASDEVHEIIKGAKANFYIDGPQARHSDEEGFHDLARRAVAVLREIEARSEASVIAVSHRDIILFAIGRIIFGDMFNPEIYRAMHSHMIHANVGITQCTFRPEDGWALNTWSDDSHLV